MSHLDLQEHAPSRPFGVVAGFVRVKQTRAGWRICWNIFLEHSAAAVVRTLSEALPVWRALAGEAHPLRARVAPLGSIDDVPDAVAREIVQALQAAAPGAFFSMEAYRMLKGAPAP
jgi:hypothetical protein